MLWDIYFGIKGIVIRRLEAIDISTNARNFMGGITRDFFLVDLMMIYLKV